MFPTRYRSTAHGIAAASGKLGAIVTQVVLELKVFNSTTDFQSVRKPVRLMYASLLIIFPRTLLTSNFFRFILFGFLMLSGLVSTYFTPETKERSLEEISNEKQEKFISGPPPVDEEPSPTEMEMERPAYVGRAF